MSFELRGGVRAAAIPGDDPAAREVLRFASDPRERDADPDHVVAVARADEQDGIDSALVVASSSWPDPWLVAAWALAATSRLRVVLAHRIGLTAPTAAARALLTLDRLSRGRAGVHLILGSSDADVLRDGDPLDKAERYERAAEFLELFARTLDAERPFDHEGRHYRVRDALSGVRPLPGRRPELSFAGSSPAGIALAAQYADVYGVAAQDPAATRALIDQAQAAAAGHGRRLRIWANARLLLAEDDAAAERRAAAIVARAGALAGRAGDPAWIARVAPPGHDPRPTADGLRAAVAAALERTIVGGPATVARRLRTLREIGVDVLQIQLPLEDERDRELRRALLDELRDPAPAAVAAATAP
ncbi:LLM class flavin-dependent oxidoreductase [Patulibacter defluvii]|uniref:LLM class flavin-dependent oxidoreductase n=1 Tax=Patulibacter defluvii TaxID=3095358 RepID=UPI002A74F87E|nr:LLM class flavin-dependent oxidoreductase [Patulibacter sp. DM4]